MNLLDRLEAWRAGSPVPCGKRWCGSRLITAVYLTDWPVTTFWQVTCGRHEFEPDVVEVEKVPMGGPRRLTYGEVEDWLDTNEARAARRAAQVERAARRRVLGGAR